ncbi:MAG TPA: ester cyclase [Gemmatimonadales bacterium]
MAGSTRQDAGTLAGAGQEIAAIGRMLSEVYNARDFDRLDSVIAPDAEYRNVATGEVFRGAEGVKRYQRNWASAFPESRVEIQNLAACGETVTVEFIGRGRHSGPLNTPQGTIQPTGKDVELALCDVLSVRDGRITGGRTYFDLASLMRQLGVQG